MRFCAKAFRFAIPSKLDVLLFLLLTFIPFESSRTTHAQTNLATSVAQTDRRCEQCHKDIFQSYLNTPMANASGPALDRLFTGSFRHIASGVDYSVSSDKDSTRLTFKTEGALQEGRSQISGFQKLDYFLGSGHLGTTYLYSINGYLFESPVAYYRKIEGYAMKPGLEKTPRMPAGLAMNDACLRCHMSGVRKPDAGTDNHYSALPFMHTGITCESCHGDAAQHLLTGGKTLVTNPTALAPMRRDSVCIVCHLEGDTNVERKQRSIADYKPGDDIRDYMTYFTYAAAAGTSRAVSEVEQFGASRCKMASGDKMSCMNCHDPHNSPAEIDKAAYYRGKCLACHTDKLFASQHHPENQDCTSCHMPKTGSENIAHVAWTDHRILRSPDGPSLQTDQSRLELKSVFGNATHRDLGLAYYNLVVRGDRSYLASATQVLTDAKTDDPADMPVLRALGVLHEMVGDNTAAEQEYRTILSRDTMNLAARTNLGTLLAKSGHLQDAVDTWMPAFNLNEDLAPLGRNLGIAQCLLGEREKAEETLRRTLLYNPDADALNNTLKSIDSGQRPCSPGMKPQ